MTEQQAIISHIAECKHRINNIKNFMGSNNDADYEQCINNIFVLESVIKALEKQIAKKPRYVDTRFRNHGRSIADGCSLDKCYQCPTCGTHLFHVWDSEKYCNKCGQLLDWGNEDDRENQTILQEPI